MRKLLAGVAIVGFLLMAASQDTSRTAIRIILGAATPATCNVGDVFYQTNAPAGLYLCTATNSFTLISSGPATAFTIFGSASANGESLKFDSSSELLTLNTGATTTDTAGNLLPANSIILAAETRVTTTITTAANFSVGDATTPTRFANALTNITAGSTNSGLAHLNSSLINQVAAAKIRITTNVNPGAGVVRITVFFATPTPPVS